MKPEQFTQKALEAISEANELAKQYNHSQIEVEHVLAALLAQEGGVVQQVIQKVGGNMGGSLATAQRMVNADLERMPHVFGGSKPNFSPRIDKLLEHARREMQNFKDEFISVEHILLAMFDIGEGPATRALKAAGLSRENVLKALTSIRGTQRVTDQNPEGKYQALERYGRNLTELAPRASSIPSLGAMKRFAASSRCSAAAPKITPC